MAATLEDESFVSISPIKVSQVSVWSLRLRTLVWKLESFEMGAFENESILKLDYWEINRLEISALGN